MDISTLNLYVSGLKFVLQLRLSERESIIENMNRHYASVLFKYNTNPDEDQPFKKVIRTKKMQKLQSRLNEIKADIKQTAALLKETKSQRKLLDRQINRK